MNLDRATLRHRAEALVADMTRNEKVALVSGSDNWHTAPIDRFGIPAVKLTDGPNGARGDAMSGGTRAVCIPAAVSMAATFDPDLVREVGELLGVETKRRQASLLLGPTINLARHPLGGRNFECFGEDPYLTSVLAVASIEGIQSQGVGACAKHFVANDVEYRRMTGSSEVDERTLREIYLAPFEAAVNAGVWSLMAAYPKLNGVHCTEHRWLLSTLLREEWGFDGFVVSDWGATHHPWATIAAGLDLEMPGPPRALGERLLTAIANGDIAEESVDAAATRVVEFVLRSGRVGQGPLPPEESIDDPAERALVRRAAADGMVLIRNAAITHTDGTVAPVLPLDSSRIEHLAVIGPNADPGVIFGGGSASVRSHHVVSPLAGLTERFGTVTHAPGCLSHRYLPAADRAAWVGADGLSIETFDGPDLQGDPVAERHGRSIGMMLGDPRHDVPDPMSWSQRWSGTMRIDHSGEHHFGVMAVGRSRVLIDGVVVADNWTDPVAGDAFFGYGSSEVVGRVMLDAGTTIDVAVEWAPDLEHFLVGIRFGHLPPVDTDALFSDAVEAARRADAAVVVVGLNADWETESHDRPLYGLPGAQDALVRAVVDANPNTVVVVNTGAAVDMPWLDTVPAVLMSWYPGQEFGGALADVLTGTADPGGRLPITVPYRVIDGPTGIDVPGDGDHIHYREGIFTGYRWYDARDIEPRLPFGFGLSYTEFHLGNIAVIDPVGGPRPAEGEAESGIDLRVEVTNTGPRAGKAVVQVYLEAPRGEHTRAPRVLCGFGVARLDAGETTTLEILVPQRSFAVWSPTAQWHVPGGSYQLHIGYSSRDLPHTVTVER